MPTDREILKQTQGSHVASTAIVDARGAVSNMHRRTIQFQLYDAATAGTSATEIVNYMPRACRVVGIYLTTPIGVTANGSNFVTFTVAKRTAGGSATSIATRATSSVNITAKTPETLTLTAAAVELAAGDSLCVDGTKSGTGVATTAAGSFVIVNVDVEEI